MGRTKFLEEAFFAKADCDFELLEEENSEGGKDLFLSGILMQGEVKNRNNRVYPRTEIAEAVKIINSRLKEGESVMGELDHPQSLTINLDRVSHTITEAVMDGDDAVGKMKILNTPTGQIVKTLLKDGIRLGVSSRGTGKVDESGRVSGFKFATMDIVAQPSAPGAFPDSVMESLQELGIDLGQTGILKPKPLREVLVEDAQAQSWILNQFLSEIKKNV